MGSGVAVGRFKRSGQRPPTTTHIRNRLIANVLAAFLTMGGVAYGKAASATGNNARIVLCSQAGTRELLIPSLHSCSPPERNTRVVKGGLRSPRGPFLLASLGLPAGLADPSNQGDPVASDPVVTGTAGSPSGPAGPVGVSCSTGTATLAGGIGPPVQLARSR